jgi:hypothetical protein
LYEFQQNHKIHTPIRLFFSPPSKTLLKDSGPFCIQRFD